METTDIVQLRTAKTDLEKMDSVLDEYEGRLGLAKFQPDHANGEEVRRYMEYDRDTLEKLTPEHCIEISFLLTSFAFHLQRAKNREEGRIIWAEGRMKILCTPRIQQYKAGSFSQNFDAAVIGDDYTVKILEIRNYAAIRSKRLDYLANVIRDKAEIYKELSRTKRNREK